MATIYSLICFGGKNGKTVTMTIASPCVVTLTNHGLRAGTGVVFTTTGALPTGVTSGSTYYAGNVAANTFNLYDTSANAITGGATGRVNTSGSQSGTHTVKSAYYVGLSDKSRWTVGGTEYIFDSLTAWNTYRSTTVPALSTDTDVCEIGMGWSDYYNSIFILNVTAASTIITASVNGVRNSAYHYGIYPPATLALDSGYCFLGGGSGGGISISSPSTTLDGFIIKPESAGPYAVSISALACTIRKMMMVGVTAASSVGISFTSNSTVSVVEKCVVKGFVTGIKTSGFTFHSVYGCTVSGCTTGFGTDGSSVRGKYYNNISVGNTTNWGTASINTDPFLAQASHNAGLSGEAWITGTNPRFTIATTDFVDYANNGFKPVAATSPQVEVGVAHYGVTASDIADAVCPSYPGSAYNTAVTAGSFVAGLSYTIVTKGTTDFTACGATTNAVTFTDTGDTVGWTAHTLNNGDLIYFSVITTTTGISIDTLYYVVGKAANTFQVATTAGGSAIALTTNGTGTVVLPTFKATGVGTGTGTATLNAKYDIGAYEYDLGYGSWPLVRTIDFSGLVSGSQVVVYTTATTTELARNNSTGTTYSYDAAASGVTVDYTILKAGYIPIRVTGVALAATSTPITIQQQLDRAYATPSGLTFGTNVIVNVTSRVVTSLQVTTATTVQNWYSYLMDSWIASATNTTLKNVAFPVIPFGEASFTTINGIEFSDGATSISKFKRDGFRYSSDAGVTATAIWAAILTLNTPAGQQVKYRQATAGTITNAQNTGPMDQLVQVYGDASHGNFDYRGHMVLRAPKVGWSQPKPDLVATYGNLVDGLFVAALEPVLQYATTDADIDAAHLALDNTAKTYTITAAHTMLELYQRAQWWANQDAQWDADIPLTTTDGSTFTQPSTWSMSGVSYLTGGTLSGGSATLAAGTQGIAYSGVTMNLGAAGTYTFTMAGSCTVKVTPTSPSTYVFGSGTFNGTLTVNNMAAHAITIEIPAGVTTSTTGNTGGAITFTAPAIYQSVTVSGITTTSRVQIYDTTSSTQLYNGVPGATSYTWTDSVAAASTRAIRVRIADVVGATAKNFIEANIGTCATSGSGKDISYLASQTNDTTYNSNAINGPTIYATSGITFTDAATDLVNCNIAGGSVTYPTIYACFVYWNFTATGIANNFTYIDAPDTANYLFSGMKIRNTSAVDLVVSGGYGRDATTLTSAAIIDTAGSTGNIFLAPDHVVPYQTTGTYAITGDISTVLTAVSNVPANVLTAAQTTPIHSEIKKVAGSTITGSGTSASPWGP